MKLSDFFKETTYSADIEFSTIGNFNSEQEGLLCYSDQLSCIKDINNTKNIVAIIVTKHLKQYVNEGIVTIESENPRMDFYRLYEYMQQNKKFCVDINGSIGKNCEIHKSAIISNKAIIGNNAKVAPNVVIMDNVIIGDNVEIEAGTTIGTDGILFYRDENGDNQYIRHAGMVQIENNVKILSQTNIAKSVYPYAPTRIGSNALVGVAAIIGHDVWIGANVVISGNCLLARGVKIENNAWIGSSAVIREYVKIGEKAQVMAGSIVVEDVDSHSAVSGNFALNHRLNMRTFVQMKKGKKVD